MPCATQSKNMFKNASNKRGHAAKTFNPFLPLAVQPQGNTAPQSHGGVTPGSCRGPIWDPAWIHY